MRMIHFLWVITMNNLETKIKQLQQEHQFTLSKISHEIRNPVTLVNSFLQLLSEKHPDITECEYWDDIMDNLDYLKALLDELSAYNNSCKLTKKAVPMDAFLQKTVGSMRPILEYLNIQFECHFSEPLPVMEIDETKLRQGILNLLRNASEAIKPPGKISFTALTEDQALSIIISDNGCGIPREYMDTLFEPFVTHKSGGTGLGLSIAKNVAEAHGGKISVNSKDSGTTFILRLPLPQKVKQVS